MVGGFLILSSSRPVHILETNASTVGQAALLRTADRVQVVVPPPGSDENIMGSGGQWALTLDEIRVPRVGMRASGEGALGLSPWLPSGLVSWLDPSRPSASGLGSLRVSGSIQSPIVSDGEFVWGPNVGRFDPAEYLADRSSPLAPYGDELALWADYTSVNPKVLLAVLQMRYGWVDGSIAGLTPAQIEDAIHETALTLAKHFYQHLYSVGARRPSKAGTAIAPPLVGLSDGSAVQLDPSLPSGTFAVAAALGESADLSQWEVQVSTGGPGSFSEVYGAMFPGSDPTSTTNDLNPPASVPPTSLLQFPFPLGAVWTFGGPHSWNGDSTPPFSSMDFFLSGGTCSAPPFYYATAAAGGTSYHPSYYSCWLEIDNGGGWTTSYYHLRNTYGGGSITRNWAVGSIACELCAGGWASGPHVHFSLKYNGAYVSLEGVQLSGWTVHVGSVAYTSGYIERDGISLQPYSNVLNDYHLYYPDPESSLRFHGNGTAGIDRVKIRIDDPSNSNPGPPVDVGSQDFTIEWWMKTLAGEDTAQAITCGGNNNWVHGNTILDRSRRDNDNDYGVSVAGGHVAFGVGGAGTGDFTLCGQIGVTDGQWHHIAVERRRSDGHLWIFVDGRLDAQADGPDGDVSYPDNGVPANLCGPTGDQPCTDSDPFLVIGAGKFDLGSQFPPFSGWLDELRFSNSLRYSGTFTPPAQPFSPDAGTVALFHFNEGTGIAVNDVSGYPRGPSNGLLAVGGTPSGPEWSSDILWSSSTTHPASVYLPLISNGAQP